MTRGRYSLLLAALGALTGFICLFWADEISDSYFSMNGQKPAENLLAFLAGPPTPPTGAPMEATTFEQRQEIERNNRASEREAERRGRIVMSYIERRDAFSGLLSSVGRLCLALGIGYVAWETRRNSYSALLAWSPTRRLLSLFASVVVRAIAAAGAVWIAAVWLWGIIVDWGSSMDEVQYVALMFGPPPLLAFAVAIVRWAFDPARHTVR